jgi:tRNA pseudouridine55 synthase
VTSVVPAGSRARGELRTTGVLALDKPAGITSFDAVREVRRIFGERRVGHAGTLDPMATGLLPICIGRATRLVDYFHAQPKTYHCVVRLGERSDTFDLEGAVVTGMDASHLTRAAVQNALVAFVGDITQVPPMHSAVRHEGRHLYELAREGQEVERLPRPATIHSIDLVDFRPGAVAEAEVLVTSGKGAYMRVLAADLGEALHTGGLLGWLSRTRYGSLTLENAISIDALGALEDPRVAILDVGVAVAHLPRVDVGPALAQQLRRGQSVWLPRTSQPDEPGECRAHTPDGQFVAIGEMHGGLLRPTKVIAA